MCGSVVLTRDGADIYLSRAKSPHNRGFPQGGLPHTQVSVPNQTAWGGVGRWLGKEGVEGGVSCASTQGGGSWS